MNTMSASFTTGLNILLNATIFFYFYFLELKNLVLVLFTFLLPLPYKSIYHSFIVGL